MLDLLVICIIGMYLVLPVGQYSRYDMISVFDSWTTYSTSFIVADQRDVALAAEEGDVVSFVALAVKTQRLNICFRFE